MLRFIAVVFVFFILLPSRIDGQLPGSDDGENKCGGCPCNNPCVVPSPPPPPPPSSPPPPYKPPSSSSSSSCPPPPTHIPSGGSVVPTSPSSQYIYFTGPPGNLYPVDQNFSRAARRFSGGGLFILNGGIVLIILLALWR